MRQKSIIAERRSACDESAELPDELRRPRVAYVLKVYPRFSQTFVVNEILAHQHAQQPVDIFSLRRPKDARFHAALASVESPVCYLEAAIGSAEDFWTHLRRGARELPELWTTLRNATSENASDVAQAFQLACEVRQQGIDHLHAHFGNVAAGVARLAAKMAGITYSFTAHARDIFHENVCLADLRDKLKDAAFVATVSQFNLSYLRQTYPAATGHVECLYNGLDLDSFSYLESQERPPLILGVGRLIEKKGFFDLIDAFAILANRGRDFSCEIIGHGPLETELRRRVDQLGLEQRVRLVGGLPSGEVIQRMRQARVLAAPCVVAHDGDRDGLPTVLLEAMALGTACISTNVTGIPEAIHDGDTGLMVPPHDARRLADACEKLLLDQHGRRQLAQAARRLVEAKFCVNRNSEQLRQLFDRAITMRSNDRVAGRTPILTR